MIIKPAADGNLVLQDRAGGAVLTTGATNATLGTITGGTLQSGVTFPAGHIIQVASDSNSTTGAGPSVSGSSGDTNTHGYQLFNTSFTPKFANSKIIIQTSNLIEIKTMLTLQLDTKGFNSNEDE